MPGQGAGSVQRFQAFEAAVPVFGRWPGLDLHPGRLGDTSEQILGIAAPSSIGVYPFVVPFVPIRAPAGSHLAAAGIRHDILAPLSEMLRAGRMIQRHQGRLRQMRRVFRALDL
jgi:hypothetical protein